jgi:hypothetical protein
MLVNPLLEMVVEDVVAYLQGHSNDLHPAAFGIAVLYTAERYPVRWVNPIGFVHFFSDGRRWEPFEDCGDLVRLF